MMRKSVLVVAAVAAMMVATVGPALAAEPGADGHREYQCSPGLLGTGLLCTAAPAPGPAPEGDVFHGGPVGADSALATTLRGLLGA